ncbi:hypothetical protein BJ508DRAFT_365185 [Ascobolus immersus RN42]|uniref:Uncharacterized protein n=1 Tax=Ascobolus immersus RN42 TaxID=1160509 RepID=A0A3N4HQV3_ASCIM|nr:hypothetical protein BJ508DRAFT_365185 [Ascobolus immersus RN42]
MSTNKPETGDNRESQHYKNQSNQSQSQAPMDELKTTLSITNNTNGDQPQAASSSSSATIMTMGGHLAATSDANDDEEQTEPKCSTSASPETSTIADEHLPSMSITHNSHEEQADATEPPSPSLAVPSTIEERLAAVSLSSTSDEEEQTATVTPTAESSTTSLSTDDALSMMADTSNGKEVQTETESTPSSLVDAPSTVEGSLAATSHTKTGKQEQPEALMTISSRTLLSPAAPGLLKLPVELHLEIADHLEDLFSLTNIRAVCRTLYNMYTTSHTKRLSYLLQNYLSLHMAAGYRGQDNIYNSTIRVLHKSEYGEDFCVSEDNIAGKDWIVEFLTPLMRCRNAESVRDLLMKLNGTVWDCRETVFLVLRKAIRHSGPQEKHIEHIRMLARRLVELDGRNAVDHVHLVNSAVYRAKIHCLRAFEEEGICRKQQMSTEDKHMLLQNAFRSVERLTSIYPEIFDHKAILQVAEFVVERLEMKVTAASVNALVDGMERDCYGANQKTLAKLVPLYEDLLALFIRNGLDVKTHSLTDDSFLPAGRKFCAPVLKMFAQSGAYLGPFENGAKGRLHYGWLGLDVDYLRLLLQQGCKVDILDDNGVTPLGRVLHGIVRHFNEVEEEIAMKEDPYLYRPVVKFFLENGADPLIAFPKGETAMTVAMFLGHQSLIDDLVLLDSRRDERYGSLSESPKEVYEEWLGDGDLWVRLLPSGALKRSEIESRIAGIRRYEK